MERRIRCGALLSLAIALVGAVAAQDSPAQLRFVHAMPGAPAAVLAVNGTTVATAQPGLASEAYVPVDAGAPTAAVQVGAVEVVAAQRDLRGGFRYLAVLHRDADGAPALLVLSGPSGRTMRGAVLLRAVNLVAGLERVRVVHVATPGVAPCASSSFLSAQPYGSAGSYDDWEIPYRGPTTLCVGGEALLPTEAELPVGSFHAELGQSLTVYVVQGPDGLQLLKVEDTP